MMNNANQSQEKQIKALRSFIAYQVDVIAFSPIVEDGWDSVLREAKEAGFFEWENFTWRVNAGMNYPQNLNDFLSYNEMDGIESFDMEGWTKRPAAWCS